VEDSTPGLPFRVAGPRSPGRTPPNANVGARTPCPKAKARAGSNTRHGSPHSTGTPLISCSSEPLSCWRQGPSTSVLAQGHAGGAGGATHRTLAQGVRCQLNGFPRALLKGHGEAVGGEPARPCPRGRAGAFSLCPVSRPALSSLCGFCCMAVLSGLGTPA